MKTFIFLVILCCIAVSTVQASWFTHDDQPYQQQIHDLQSQVAQQAHQNTQQVIVIIILSVSVVLALVVGAAIGSRARKAAKEVEH